MGSMNQSWLTDSRALERARKREHQRIARVGGRKALNQAVTEGRAYRVVGSLHGLSCTGPTRATGCRCRQKITWLRRMEEAA